MNFILCDKTNARKTPSCKPSETCFPIALRDLFLLSKLLYFSIHRFNVLLPYIPYLR